MLSVVIASFVPILSQQKDVITVLGIFKTFNKVSDFTILTIANHSDKHNGVELHIIQENMSYWKPIIEKYFDILTFDEKYNGRLYLLNLKNKKWKKTY